MAVHGRNSRPLRARPLFPPLPLFCIFFQRRPKDFKRFRLRRVCKANALAEFMVGSRHDSQFRLQSQLHLHFSQVPPEPSKRIPFA